MSEKKKDKKRKSKEGEDNVDKNVKRGKKVRLEKEKEEERKESRSDAAFESDRTAAIKEFLSQEMLYSNENVSKSLAILDMTYEKIGNAKDRCEANTLLLRLIGCGLLNTMCIEMWTWIIDNRLEQAGKALLERGVQNPRLKAVESAISIFLKQENKDALTDRLLSHLVSKLANVGPFLIDANLKQVSAEDVASLIEAILSLNERQEGIDKTTVQNDTLILLKSLLSLYHQDLASSQNGTAALKLVDAFLKDKTPISSIING